MLLKTNPKEFGKTIKPFINSWKNTRTGRIILHENNNIKLIRNQQETAETLKQFFTSVTKNKELKKAVPDLKHMS